MFSFNILTDIETVLSVSSS